MGDPAGDNAVLEWLNSEGLLSGLPGAPSHHVQRLGDLRDGILLLQIMHDVSPDIFHQQSADPIEHLLEGLQLHFQDREGERVAQCLLEQLPVLGEFEISELARLVVVATLIGDGETHSKYVQICQQLSGTSMQAIHEMFSGLEPALHADSSPSLHTQAHSSRPGEFSPPRSFPEFKPLQRGLDFTDVGLDLEARFRMLKQQYVALMEEKERWDDERAAMMEEVKTERDKRRAAEEAEKIARQELRKGDEDRERIKDEHRTMFETRLELEVARHIEQFRWQEEELQKLQDELDIAKSQAGQSERFESQLRECRKMLEVKSEELARQRESNAELTSQNDSLLSSASSGAVEHLHKRIEQLRSEYQAVVRERDVAQEHSKMLRVDTEKLQHSHRELSDELTRLKRESQRNEASRLRANSPGMGRSPSGSIANLSEEARLALLQLDGQSSTPSRRDSNAGSKDSILYASSPLLDPRRSSTPTRKNSCSKPRPPPLPLEGSRAASPAVSQSPKGGSGSGNNTDLLERLLAANERATRSETTLQIQKAQTDALTEQTTRDAARIKALEDQLHGETQKLQELQRCGAEAKDEGKIKEQAERGKGARNDMMEAQLLQKERELQVYRWRGQADSNNLAQQEYFMGACFHEVGLKYHKLRTQHELLKRRNQQLEKQCKAASNTAASSLATASSVSSKPPPAVVVVPPE